MVYSRLSRFEERREKQRLIYAIGGSLLILVFLGVFGFKILVGFSLVLDKLRGASPTTQTAQVILQPPVLDPLPIATNSASFILTGKAQPKLTLIVYFNDQETKKLTVPDDGNFKITDLNLKDGVNTLSAKVMDEKGNLSDLSNVVSTQYGKTPPILEVSSPVDNSTVYGDDPLVVVVGQTNEDAAITINDRLAVVKNDGSFSYTYRLGDGDNTLKIVSTDPAGNQTTLERHIKYQK